MASHLNTSQLSVRSFKQILKDKIREFAADPSVFTEMAFLRTVRRTRWDASTDYYGNRKHHSTYKRMREAKEAGLPVPRGNPPPPDTSAYPIASRIRLERESYGNHQMHAQLRRSIVAVLEYLVDKLDLVSGVVVEVKKKRYREVYIREIAKSAGIGKRTTQRALANLARHGLINRGVALIGVTPKFYKDLGLYSYARALVGSLKALMQRPGYRGTKIDPERIIPHRCFHKFSVRSAARPSIRKFLASIQLSADNTSSARSPQPKVPRGNSYEEQCSPPPMTGPPHQDNQTAKAPKSQVGLDTLRSLKTLLPK